MKLLTGTHKTRCAICGGRDNLVMRYNGKSMIDLCYKCAIMGAAISTRNTMIFTTKYSGDCYKLNPGCHHGSEFCSDCVDKFEEIVWIGFMSDWIRKNRKVY
jgi:hypothetical protein